MPAGLIALAAWALFAFAGTYRWTLAPIVAGAAALAIAGRVKVGQQAHRTVDAALAGCLAVLVFQLIPLSEQLRRTLTPSAGTVEARLLLGAADGPRPVTLDAEGTAWAVASLGAALAVFWAARTMFERDGGVRRVCRAIAWCGLILAAVAFVQRALTPSLIYGVWEPLERESAPTPWGPFVNRNIFATWLVMAIPLVLGYVMLRVSSRPAGRPLDVEKTFDARMAVVATSLCLMTAALLASLSRSGILSLGVALTIFLAAARRRLRSGRLAWLAGGVAALMLLASMYADLSALTERVQHAVPSGLGGRTAIWRDTWPIARDFLWTGVGAGAFDRAMLVYQQGSRLIFFNHAHNEYLQVLVEGGLLLAVPASIAVVAGTRIALQRLRDDVPAMFWVRTGALSGVGAVAAQSVWDTGLRLPANAVLFALLAAIAVHRPLASPARTTRGRARSGKTGPDAGLLNRGSAGADTPVW